MAPYSVGLNGVRVGLIVVGPDAEDQGPPVATLNSITSQTTLKASLNQLQYYTWFNSAGQYLTYNLKLVSSIDFMTPTNGYRANIDNHLLVYITSSTEFDSDPSLTARAILQQKQYGIITVGYGSGVNNEKLKEISGGRPCSLTANSVTELENLIKPIQRHIMFADANHGLYCSRK